LSPRSSIASTGLRGCGFGGVPGWWSGLRPSAWLRRCSC